MRLAGVLQVRCRPRDDRAQHDEAGPVGDGLGLAERGVQRRDVLLVRRVVVGPVDGLHVPAVGLVARPHVLGERDVGVVLDRDPVGVVDDGQVAEPLHPGDGRGLGAHALLDVAVAAQRVDVVVERGRAVGRVGVEQAALAAGGHRHADRVADALAERAGGGLDAGGVAVLRVAGRLGAPGAQRLDVVELQAPAAEEQLEVERQGRVAAGQHEAVAARPVRVGRVVPHHLLEQQVRRRGEAHRGAGMAVADLLHGVHGEDPHGVHRLGVQIGPVQPLRDAAHGGPHCSRWGSGPGRHRAYSSPGIDSMARQYPISHRPNSPLTARSPVSYVGQRTSGPASSTVAAKAGFKDVVMAYVGLTKPRVIELLLLTTVPVMFFAEGGVPGLGLVAATVVGGTLSAGSASALNCVYDRDIDEQMRRTRRRALPRHIVSPVAATVFGVVLGVLATVILARLGQPALRGAGPGRRGVLPAGLHGLAQAPDHPEHRLGRPGRLLPGADRLDRGHRRARLAAGRAVHGGVLLDPAAHLGAGAALPRRLRRRGRADAAGGRAARRGRPPDRALHLGDGRHVAAAVAGGGHRPRVRRGRGRARRGVPGGGAPALGPRPGPRTRRERRRASTRCGCSTCRTSTSRCCSSPSPWTRCCADARPTTTQVTVAETSAAPSRCSTTRPSGRSRKYCVKPTRPCASSTTSSAPAARATSGAPGAVGEDEQPDRQRDQEVDGDRVHVGHHLRVQAGAPGVGVARVRPAAGDDGAEVEHDPGVGEHQPGQPAHARPAPRVAPGRAASSTSSDADADDRHRHQQVQGHDPGVEVGEHGDAADHRLERDAEHDDRGQHQRAAPPGRPARRPTGRARAPPARRSASGCRTRSRRGCRARRARRRTRRCSAARSGSPGRSR